MTRRTYLLLFLLGLAVASLVAAFQSAPGYMDAEYYLIGGQQLAQGAGLTEPFIWNYLNDPPGPPVASHTYWMPLASFLAFAGMKLSGSASFSAGRIPFLLIAALQPALAAALAWRLTRQRQTALLAGLLAVFPAFYLPFLPTTDTFGLYMLLGSLFLLTVSALPPQASPPPADPRSRSNLPTFQLATCQWLLSPLALGLISGLMHLARADGILWLGLALLLSLRLRPLRLDLPRAAFTLLGYLLVMGPWLARNLGVVGAPLGPGSARALWFLSYDDLYLYPAAQLTFARWWGQGLGSIVQARLQALAANLQTVLAVQGEIFLLPLIGLGAWRWRGSPLVRAGLLAGLLTLLVMTLVFPFPGMRGGLFHSGAALQPLLWALAAAGLDPFLEWGGRKRGWQISQARPVFSAGLVGLSVLLSLVLVYTRVIGADLTRPAWSQAGAAYARLENGLRLAGAGAGEVAMVNNPPGFALATGRPAIAIPHADLPAVLAAARRYNARYLVLEIDQIPGSPELFDEPGSRPGLEYLTKIENAVLYRFDFP